MNENKVIKVGFIGAGKIAHTLAKTFLNYKNKFVLYGVASKDKERSNKFKEEFNFIKVYSSYNELVEDDDIDLVYISTLISEHHDHIRLCIEHNKPCLCEKSLCDSYGHTKYVVNLAKSKNIFLAEALWSRYMPSRDIIKTIVDSKVIGDIYYVEANLGYEIKDLKRIKEVSLGGGAMLDVGIYPLNFILMINDDSDIKSIDVASRLLDTGVDETLSINISFTNNLLAHFFTTINNVTSRDGYIYGDKGYIKVININNPEKIEVYTKENIDDRLMTLTSSINIKEEFNGYEYELLETYNSLINNEKENKSIKLDDSLKLSKLMETILHKAHYKGK